MEKISWSHHVENRHITKTQGRKKRPTYDKTKEG